MKQHAVFGKITAIVLSAALLSTTVLCGCAKKDTTEETPVDTSDLAAVTDVLTATGTTLSKDETVYVLCGADGAVDRIIVSDWLKNGTQDTTINDKTTLQNPEVVKGSASYSLDSDNMTVWDAEGGDVCYQGTSDKPLPVDVTVSYRLDGQPISAEELAGKSGRVTIRFDYTNNVYETKTVNGSAENIYVPFAMLTGLVLDTDTFRNIEISNGKLIETGDKSIAVGVALPGLAGDLALTDGTLNLPESVEITADTTNFSLGNTVTMASNSLFNDARLSGADKLDSLSASMNDLTDGMAQLMDGSSTLYGGLATLLEKSETLAASIKQLAAVTQTLRASGAGLYDGTLSLQDNLDDLSTGLGDLNENNDTLDAGAEQVFDTLLATANAQLAASLAPYTAYGITAPTLTIENYADSLMALIATLSHAGADTTALTALKDQLDSYNTFYTGLLSYTDGVADAYAGSQQLLTGADTLTGYTAQMKDALSQLDAAVGQLNDSVGALPGGVGQLKDGASQLSGGLNDLNDRGIEKLAQLVQGDLGGLSARISAVREVSQDYNNYAGIADGMDGSVQFVYRTDSIGAQSK